MFRKMNKVLEKLEILQCDVYDISLGVKERTFGISKLLDAAIISLDNADKELEYFCGTCFWSKEVEDDVVTQMANNLRNEIDRQIMEDLRGKYISNLII